jgi:hypothetical protein
MMSRDVSVIEAFCISITLFQFSKGPETHLLVLQEDNKLLLHSASEFASTAIAHGMVGNLDSFRAWKLFNDKHEAEVFIAQLKEADNIVLASEVKEADNIVLASEVKPVEVTSPPCTMYSPAMAENATVGVGNMMAREEVIAGVEAAEVAADAAKAEVTADAAKAEVAADSAKAESLSNNDGKQSVQNPYLKSPYTAPKSGSKLDNFDTSKMKFSFGKGGSKSGGPEGFDVTVSHGFSHKHHPYRIALVMIKKISTNIWHIDSSLLKGYCDQISAQLIESKGLDKPLFMTTLRDLSICDPSNPHDFKRIKKIYTQNRIMWFVLVHNGYQLKDVVDQSIQTISSPFKQTVVDCGSDYAKWLSEKREVLIGLRPVNLGQARSLLTMNLRSKCS